MRLLFVSKSLATQKQLTQVACRLGLDYICASSHREAEVAVKGSPFSAVLMQHSRDDIGLTRFVSTVRRYSAGCRLYVLDSAAHRDAIALGEISPQEALSRIATELGHRTPRTNELQVLCTIAHRQSWRSDLARHRATGCVGVAAAMTRDVADSARDLQTLRGVMQRSLTVQHRYLAVAELLDLGGAQPFVLWQVPPGNTLSVLSYQNACLPVEMALAVVAMCAEAIAPVHAAGLIHGCLDPSSVWLAEDGTLRLLHLGIGHFGECRRRQSPDGRYSQDLPMDDLAPEQLADLVLGPTLDVYQLGLLLYQLLCQRRPFQADANTYSLEAIKTRPPLSPRCFNPQVPVAIADFTLRLLAKNPAHRPQNGHQLRREIDSLLPRKTGLLKLNLGGSQRPQRLLSSLLEQCRLPILASA